MTARQAKSRLKRSRLAAVGYGGLFTSTIVAPQLLGGAPGWAVGLIGASSVVVLALVAAGTEGLWSDRAARVVWLVLLVACAWTVLQAIPIPCSLLELLSPRAAADQHAAAEALSRQPVCSLSMDPGATRMAAIQWSAVLCTFLATAIAVTNGQRTSVMTAIAVSCVAVAGVTLIHVGAGMMSVFGVYDPIYARPVLMSPFLNSNNLAGFLNLGAPLAISVAVTSSDFAKRATWSVLSALVCLTVVLSRSRAGLAVCIGELIVLAILLPGKASATRKRIGGTVGVLLLALGYAVLGPLGYEFDTGTSKLELHSRALAFLVDAPSVGVGRGAFAAAFAAHHGSRLRFEHAENLLLDGAIEWGAPAMIVLTAGLSYAVYLASRRPSRRPSTSRLAATVGLVGFLAHSMFDYSVDLAAPAIVSASLLATVVATSSSRHANHSPWPAIGTTVFTALTCALFIPRLETDYLQAARSNIQEALAQSDSTRVERLSKHAIEAHPSEPSLYVLVGANAVRDGDPDALPLLNRAMLLAPGWSAPHALTARWLQRQGLFDQSVGEIHAALERGADDVDDLLCAALDEDPRVDTALRAAPRGRRDERTLTSAAACFDLESPVGARLDELTLATSPTNAVARSRTARRLIAAGRPDDALSILGQPARSDGQQLILARVEALAAAGRGGDARRLLTSLPGRPAEALLRRRAELEVADGDAEAVHSTIEELRAQAGTNARQIVRVLIFSADLEWRLGNKPAAFSDLELAFETFPTASVLRRIAALAEQSDDAARAYHAYQRLTVLEPDVESHRENRERAERELRSHVLR